MRVQRVVTNETCNHNCWFCNARRPAERPDFVARRAVIERIAEARAGAPREIVLTGGEPTLRSDIADLVRRARGDDETRVVLETNATAVDAARAAALAAAGLDTARVHLTGADAETADAISRDRGGFAAALAGIRALAAAGVRVEVATPVVRRNLDRLAALPGAIAAAELPVAALVLVIPTSAPDAAECAPLEAVADTVCAVAEGARRHGLTVRLDPTTFLPPCLFEKPERVAHLYALNRGNAERDGYRQVEACGECLVADRCPGLPVTAAAPPAALYPITEHRMRRRLTVVSTVEDQIARELVTRDQYRGDSGPPVTEVTVRINFHCNQACEFCFVSTHLPPASEAAVRAAIEAAASEGAVVILSGGEPTLNPRLPDYVGLAARRGAAAIELQTNATRLAGTDLAERLVSAGLSRAMVSLHGSTAEISDAVTGAPGTFDATVRGIDALLRTGIDVRLNFVVCQANRTDFADFIDLVAQRWPAAGVVLSFVGSHTDVVPRTPQLIPRFSEVMPTLAAGLARAREIGLRVTGFESMCGLPLCLLPESERSLAPEMALDDDGGGGEFVKAPACATCRENRRCYGVRRGYADLYGTDELHPLGTGPAAPAAADGTAAR